MYKIPAEVVNWGRRDDTDIKHPDETGWVGLTKAISSKAKCALCQQSNVLESRDKIHRPMAEEKTMKSQGGRAATGKNESVNRRVR